MHINCTVFTVLCVEQMVSGSSEESIPAPDPDSAVSIYIRYSTWWSTLFRV